MSSKFLVIRLAFEPETQVFHFDNRDEAFNFAQEKLESEQYDWNVYEIFAKDGVPVDTENVD